MPAPVFTPEQEAEIRRMIAVSRLAGELAGDIVESPTPTEEEKGDLEIAVEVLDAFAKSLKFDYPYNESAFFDYINERRFGASVIVEKLKAMLPGRDLARAKDAEKKIDNLRRAHDLWKEEARRYAENCSRAEIKLATAESKLAKVEASREKWRGLVEQSYEHSAYAIKWVQRFNEVLASDKEAGL